MSKRFLTRILLAAGVFGLALALPQLSLTGSTGAASDLGLASSLAQGSVAAFAIAFAGGVLTSLTPCVYPLIPITVSIFGARSAASRRDAVVLSALYVLGIAAMYSALGVAAALGGKAFGSVMQNPAVLVLVAVVFAAMAASMFGAFELQLPASLQARLSGVGGAGRAGAFAMGLVAGVVAAPCTGPVLAAALAYVATKGSVAFGFGIMFAYALGIGLLFFAIGAFSVSLPKSGAWMETVKGVFGVALLTMAALYLKDAFPALRSVFSTARGAALAGGAVAAAGVLAGALTRSFDGPARERAWKGVAVAMTVLGLVYATGSGAARREALVAPLPWMTDETAALALARAEGRPVVIDFWAEWCAACKELDHVAWADASVREELSRFVLLKIDATEETPAVTAAWEKYGIVGMPTVVFIDSKGRELPAADRVAAVLEPAEMLKKLKAVDAPCLLAQCVPRW
jgi:thiol:disulfide interchange protein DsbD